MHARFQYILLFKTTHIRRYRHAMNILSARVTRHHATPHKGRAEHRTRSSNFLLVCLRFCSRISLSKIALPRRARPGGTPGSRTPKTGPRARVPATMCYGNHRQKDGKEESGEPSTAGSNNHDRPFILTSYLRISPQGDSPERRCSSRTFRYGYLVTTSPPSPGVPSAPSPLRLD